MIFLYGDEGRAEKTPFVNWAIIAANVGVFVVVALATDAVSFAEKVAGPYGLVAARFELADCFTSMFLHGDVFRLAAAMSVLFVIGDNLEDALGHAGYLACYLLGGLGAAGWHVWMGSAARGPGLPCIGSAGAVGAMMGLFIVARPSTRLRFAMILPSLGWPLLVKPTAVRFALGGAGGVCYWLALSGVAFALDHATGGGATVAHISPAAGVAVGLVLAAVLGIVTIIDAKRFGLGAFAGGKRPAPQAAGWASAEVSVTGREALFTPARTREGTGPMTPRDREAGIRSAMESGDVEGAANLYREYLAAVEGAALDAALQLRMAGCLADAGETAEGRAAYELFIEKYPASPKIEDARDGLAGLGGE